MTAHEIALDRTMLGERFIHCICGDVSQGPAIGDIADRNFAYHQTQARAIVTRPQWNCIDYPNDGPHYVPGNDKCLWCGATVEAIRAEYEIDELLLCGCPVGARESGGHHHTTGDQPVMWINGKSLPLSAIGSDGEEVTLYASEADDSEAEPAGARDEVRAWGAEWHHGADL